MCCHRQCLYHLMCLHMIYFDDTMYCRHSSMINHCLDHVIDDNSLDVLVSLFCYVQLLVWLTLVNLCSFLCNMLTVYRPLDLNFVIDVLMTQCLFLGFLGCHAVDTVLSYEMIQNFWLLQHPIWNAVNPIQSNPIRNVDGRTKKIEMIA